MRDISINIGYDIVGVQNLYDYNIQPIWNMDNNANIVNLLDNTLGTFKENTVNYYIENNLNFIYPIILFDNKLFENYKTIELNENLLLSIKNKKCKIVFIYVLEGYFDYSGVNWVNNLSNRFNFDNDDIIVITANLIEFSNCNFTVYQYNYFGNHINFLPISKLDLIKVNSFKKNYTKFINNTPTFHFLCFNGIPRKNRVLMFNELNNNNKLIGKSISTLRGIDKNYYYDVPNWENQKIGGGARLNIDAHLNCFLNVVTETLFDNNSIFLSEKTYKPIYMCQPFIIFGNPYSLKKLKELGYRTFDKWWDESYDLEFNLDKRFNKIVSILEEISNWSIDECIQFKEEMQQILIHNYLNMFENYDMIKLFNKLKCDINVQSLI